MKSVGAQTSPDEGRGDEEEALANCPLKCTLCREAFGSNLAGGAGQSFIICLGFRLRRSELKSGDQEIVSFSSQPFLKITAKQNSLPTLSEWCDLCCMEPATPPRGVAQGSGSHSALWLGNLHEAALGRRGGIPPWASFKVTCTLLVEAARSSSAGRVQQPTAISGVRNL